MIRDDFGSRPSSRAKLLGACAGVGDSTGLDVTLLRAATLIALCLWFKLAILAYCGAALYVRMRR